MALRAVLLLPERGEVNMTTDTLFSVVLPAFLGLVAGVVGSLVAPWVHWGIEKRREKM